MENKTNFRARVMKYAWHLFRVTRQAWKICMIKAWQIYRLSKAMKKEVVTFWYAKTDGSIRKAIGTLSNLPESIGNGKGGTKPAYKTLTYFDVQKNGFRCFKIENLICVCN